jgi:hypothetical protein
LYINKDIAGHSKRINHGDVLREGPGETMEGTGKCTAFLTLKETFAGGNVIIFSTIHHRQELI